MWLVFHAGVKDDPCQWKGSWSLHCEIYVAISRLSNCKRSYHKTHYQMLKCAPCPRWRINHKWPWFTMVYVVSEHHVLTYVHYLLDRFMFHHDFHHDSCDYHWDFYGHYLPFDLHFSLPLHKYFWFCKFTTPWMFLPLDILLEYWIENVSFGLLYVMFIFPTRMFYGEAPGFATDCPCGVWYSGLSTCPLYVVRFLEI